MAGLPNSSNALQQWHRLFEAQGQPRSEQAQQHLQQMLLGWSLLTVSLFRA